MEQVSGGNRAAGAACGWPPGASGGRAFPISECRRGHALPVLAAAIVHRNVPGEPTHRAPTATHHCSALLVLDFEQRVFPAHSLRDRGNGGGLAGLRVASTRSRRQRGIDRAFPSTIFSGTDLPVF